MEIKPLMNFDYSSLYPRIQKPYNIIPTKLKSILRKRKIKKLFDL